MDQQQFWDAIEEIDKPALLSADEHQALKPLLDHLMKQDPIDLIDFYKHLTNALFKLDTRRHFEHAPDSPIPDSFLQFRCYVVGMGRRYYYDTREHPQNFPTKFVSLSPLLKAAPAIWARLTKQPLPKFYELVADARPPQTASNENGWKHVRGVIRSIGFGDTSEMIESLLKADRRVPASIGGDNIYLGTEVCHKLERLGFRAPGYLYIVIDLIPSLPHGEIRHRSGDKSDKRIDFDAGIDARLYVQMSEEERKLTFVDLISRALLWLAARDDLDTYAIGIAIDFARTIARQKIDYTPLLQS